MYEPPNPDDCCNSGCNPCILDVIEKPNPLVDFTGKSCTLQTAYSIFKLVNVENHTEKSRIYTFEFVEFAKNVETEEEDYVVKYNPGQHFLLKGTDFRTKNEFTRAYTPLYKWSSEKTQFSVLIKLYDDGLMSKCLRKFETGAKTSWRGPYGDYSINYDLKHVILIAQGTGIAPCYSIIKKMLENEECYTFIKLFYCCSNCDEIFLRNELYNFNSYWNFTYEVFLSDTTNYYCKYNETIHKTKLDTDFLQIYLKQISNDYHTIVCGSEKFNEHYKAILPGNIVIL